MPEDNPARKSLKLVLGAAGCAFVTPLATKDKREYGHRCHQQDGEHDGPKLAEEAEPALRDGLSSALLPPPALGERRHRGGPPIRSPRSTGSRTRRRSSLSSMTSTPPAQSAAQWPRHSQLQNSCVLSSPSGSETVIVMGPIGWC